VYKIHFLAVGYRLTKEVDPESFLVKLSATGVRIASQSYSIESGQQLPNELVKILYGYEKTFGSHPELTNHCFPTKSGLLILPKNFFCYRESDEGFYIHTRNITITLENLDNLSVHKGNSKLAAKMSQFELQGTVELYPGEVLFIKARYKEYGLLDYNDRIGNIHVSSEFFPSFYLRDMVDVFTHALTSEVILENDSQTIKATINMNEIKIERPDYLVDPDQGIKAVSYILGNSLRNLSNKIEECTQLLCKTYEHGTHYIGDKEEKTAQKFEAGLSKLGQDFKSGARMRAIGSVISAALLGIPVEVELTNLAAGVTKLGSSIRNDSQASASGKKQIKLKSSFCNIF